ncbi:MAG: hypothetical protein NC299_17915 [Lachnospiraceae bacterium]|nr:hypothetical protein [Ruminococcus sp.]MCM1277205.1 hypothetical protein [Lachnospiraceae bacterium]
MDRIFYSIEIQDNKKTVHVHGEIYDLGCGKDEICDANRFLDSDTIYRSAEFTGAYLEIEDIQESGGKFLEYIYNNGNQVYESDMTAGHAEKCCQTYFGGESGTELNIYECDQNTPYGDYWCEIKW